VKKSSGKTPQQLTEEQQRQLQTPVKKVPSPSQKKEADKDRPTTDADLEKLKAFFGK
jgi:hypothetical protein